MAYLADRSRVSGARGSRGGRAMGADEVVRGPYAALLDQVNRFTGPSSGAHRFATTPFDVASGTLSSAAAYVALLIYQTRLLVAQTGIPDDSTQAQIAAVNAAIKSGAVAYVVKNQVAVTDAIRGYADSLGLPNVSVGKGASGTDLARNFVIAGVGVLALYLLTR